MDLISSLRTFVRVSQVGSFSAVAAERGVTQPAISRQISALEEHLGIRLVQRSTQAVTLTEEGRHFLASAEKMVDAADAMLESATRRRSEPIGAVRLSTRLCFGLYISRHLPILLDRHGELSVEIVVRDRVGALVEDSLDLEVRLGPPEDSSLIMRRIGYAKAFVVASPEYLKRHSHPGHPQDLSNRQCIVDQGSETGDIWAFREGDVGGEKDGFPISVSVGGRFRSNNVSTVYSSVLAGQGIACLADYLVADDLDQGKLVRLLPGYAVRGWPIFVTYPSRRDVPARTRIVIDFLSETLQTNFKPRISAVQQGSTTSIVPGVSGATAAPTLKLCSIELSNERKRR